MIRLFAFALLLAPYAAPSQALETGTPHETVITLTQDNIESAINDRANPLWLLKFYAPWCGHCKRLAPVLDGAAPKVKGEIAIGKIDCTIEKDLCKKHSVRGYPTLKFSLDGEIHDWPGGRGEADIVNFARKMSRPSVSFVKTIQEVHAAATEGIAFLAYDPAAVSGETPEEKTKATDFLQNFSKVARKMQAQGTFLLLDTSDTETDEEAAAMAANFGKEGPFIAKIENGVGTKFYESKPAGLQKWVQEQNTPTVAMLGAHNFMKLAQAGKQFLIACVEPKDADMARETLVKFATSPQNKYTVGVMDGVQWRQFVNQFSVTEMPQLLLVNIHSKEYWTNSTYGLNTFDFIAAVNSGKIQKRSAARTKAESILGKAYGLVMKFKPFSYIAIVLLVIGFFYSICRLCCCGWRSKKASPPTDKPGTLQEEKKEEMESKKDK